METEIIDKLFLELSQITNAKTRREIELESAIKSALNIEMIWSPPSGDIPKDEHLAEEYRALRHMAKRFRDLIIC